MAQSTELPAHDGLSLIGSMKSDDHTLGLAYAVGIHNALVFYVKYPALFLEVATALVLECEDNDRLEISLTQMHAVFNAVKEQI